MVSTEQFEQLARLLANDLPPHEAAALRAQLAQEPHLQVALEQLEALDDVLVSAPSETLSANHLDSLVEGAFDRLARKRKRQATFALMAAAAALLLSVFAVSQMRSKPVFVASALTGLVVVNGQTLAAGASVDNPQRVITGEQGVALIRGATAAELVLAPNSELRVDTPLRLERGLLRLEGTGISIEGAGHFIALSGRAVVSTEPIEGDLRDTSNLSTENLMQLKRVSVVAGLATSAFLAVYVLQGNATVTSPSGESVKVQANAVWSSVARQVAVAKADSVNAEPNQEGSGAAEEDEVFVTSDGQFEVQAFAAGKPVAAAQVRLFHQVGKDPVTLEPRWRAAGGAPTGGAGTARLAAKPGLYALSVEKAGWPATWILAQRPVGEALTRVEVVLEASLTLSGLAKDARTGKAVTPATVSVYRKGTPPSKAITVAVDSFGRFAVNNLSSGEWEVRAESPGQGQAQATVTLPSREALSLEFESSGFIEGFVQLPDGGVATGAQVIAVAKQTVAGEASASGSFSLEAASGSWRVEARLGSLVGRAAKEAVLHPGQTLNAGVIRLQTAAQLSGKVTKAGVAVAAASIHVRPHFGTGEVASGESDSSGQYAVNLGPGLYDVNVAAIGQAPHEVVGLSVSGQTTLDVALKDNGGVRGTVADNKGKPLDGVVVKLEHNGSVVHTGVTQAGAFEFENVAPGRWVVEAFASPDAEPTIEVVTVVSEKVASVALVAQQSVTIEGEIKRSCSGPPQKLTVTVFHPDFMYTMPSQATVEPTETHFRLKVRPGPYKFSVDSEGSRCVGRLGPLSFEAGETRSLSIEVKDEVLKKTVLTVLEPDGLPSVGATVKVFNPSAVDPSQQLLFYGETQSDGQAEIGWNPHKPLSNALVKVSNHGRSAKLERFSPNQPSATLTLKGASKLLLTLEGLEAGESAQIKILGDSFLDYRDSLTSTSPQVVIENLPAGRLRISVSTESKAATVEVTLKAEEDAQATVRLVEAGRIVGRLVDAAGKPRSGIVGLTAPSGSEMSQSVTVGQSGLFELKPVSAGTYLLQVDFKKVGGPIVVTATESTELGDVKTVRE